MLEFGGAFQRLTFAVVVFSATEAVRSEPPSGGLDGQVAAEHSGGHA